MGSRCIRFDETTACMACVEFDELVCNDYGVALNLVIR